MITMGLDLKPLLVREKTHLESFTNKVVAIDAYNAIYQFLAIIRGTRRSTSNRLARKSNKSYHRIAI